ncbi:alkaline phosphatase family protein [Actinospica sp. MGRD01-02]|uniref:Alkaline phosphatase family protein n=1 Tax=Actinospica acidithermotolerans TaxID=2828514 RepID=A0A941IJ64_9ACTN|nr:nucleotide pyrophosphatase/phosphodiesterase family protein [Actinospica acidithermotolerans]MBR7830400.1 alkaline phosphatase family protein [Actinospica acidithermotolerans]
MGDPAVDEDGLEPPAYQSGALSDVVPAIGAALGVPGPEREYGLWAPAPTKKACLFLIDGMGRELLSAHAHLAPYLTALLATEGGHTLTAGFPSTTSTSLASIGTGLPPGAHGMLGYRLMVPASGRLMNFLRWDQNVDPLEWQPHETMFERMTAAGIAVTHVAAPRFADSGLTRSVFRGARFSGAETVDDQARRAIEALEASERGFVYLYYRDLDFIGHTTGVGSPRWREELAYVDNLVERLAGQLPADATLFVTADHGMVDVPTDRRIDMDQDWELRAGVALLGGEARARHVYATPGAARDVLAIWQERLDGIALVRGRDQAVAEGWFGPPSEVDARMAARVGDVIVAMRDDWAVIASERETIDSRQVGMHGSLTSAEQLVPLLEIRKD